VDDPREDSADALELLTGGWRDVRPTVNLESTDSPMSSPRCRVRSERKAYLPHPGSMELRSQILFWALINLCACGSGRAVVDSGPLLPDGPTVAVDAGAVDSSPLLPDGPTVAVDAGADVGWAAAVVPKIAGGFWRIAANPDLGAYDNRPRQQPVDFGIWQAADGTWQLWSCIRFTRVGGNTRLFYHWEGQNLTDTDWTPKGIAMVADPALGETEGGLQAPHVIRVGDVWHMFYGDWKHICHATSGDGKTFTRVIQPDGNTGMFAEGAAGSVTRDPMMFVADGDYRLYYTNHTGADFVRTSTGVAGPFGPSRVVARGGSAGSNCCSAECPFVARPAPGGDYFLFRTQRYGPDAQTSVYRSPDPFDFGVDNDDRFVGHLPVAAPELVEQDGQWFVAALRGDLQGIQVARLEWQPQ
jgi:hypothetical protein